MCALHKDIALPMCVCLTYFRVIGSSARENTTESVRVTSVWQGTSVDARSPRLVVMLKMLKWMYVCCVDVCMDGSQSVSQAHQ